MTGEQIGGYFGYSVASVDVNGDGYDDIIIGAPMLTLDCKTTDYESGRVYVMYQDEKVSYVFETFRI